ncbi:MAG: TolC family protein [Flavobacteriales bacterium]|nr:TolC family protein [Flavobacteriales bacterium]
MASASRATKRPSPRRRPQLAMGLLPRVDAGARGNYSNQDTRLDFTEGIPDVERNGVVNTTLGGQLGLTYTLFNGMGNFAALERSQWSAQAAELRARAGGRHAHASYRLYYAVASLEEDVAITERLLAISNDRFTRLKGRAELGATGRLDLLNAQVDLQADSAAHILARQRRDALRAT